MLEAENNQFITVSTTAMLLAWPKVWKIFLPNFKWLNVSSLYSWRTVYHLIRLNKPKTHAKFALTDQAQVNWRFEATNWFGWHSRQPQHRQVWTSWNQSRVNRHQASSLCGDAYQMEPKKPPCAVSDWISWRASQSRADWTGTSPSPLTSSHPAIPR